MSAPEILRNVHLSKETTAGYQIGGEADYYLEACNSEDIRYGVRFAREKGIPIFVLGCGSNVLASDKGFRGMVINTLRMDAITVSSDSIKVCAGARVTSFVRESILANFAGIEELSGIPGTVGGAIVMNAGAFSQAISDKISQICIYDCQTGIENILTKKEAQFGYRSSIFRKKNCVILWALFEFPLKVAYGILAARQSEVLRKRRESQPLEHHCCGSVFKNPDNGFAGELIEQAGLKGFSVGGAEVSQLHANFIINTGDATAEDIRKVIAEVRKTAHKYFSIWLEPEVVFLGEFDTDI